MGRVGWSDLRDATFPAGQATPRTITNSADGILKSYGTEVPADGDAGYAPSCEFLHTDGSGDNVLYVNHGSSTSCEFVKLDQVPKAYGTAAGRGPSPVIWDDCPVLEYTLNPQKGLVYFNDFVHGPIAANNTTSYTGEVAWATAATTPTIQCQPDDHMGECLLFSSTDNEDAIISILHGGHKAGGIELAADKKFWFEARVKTLNTTDAKYGWFVGFAEEGLAATTTLIAAAGTMADKDYVGFHGLEGDGDTLDTVYNTAAGGGTTLKGDAITVVADTYVKVGIYCDGTTVYFYKDGVLLADSVTLATANFPNGEEMAFYMGIMNAHDDDGSVSIDWVRIAQEY